MVDQPKLHAPASMIVTSPTNAIYHQIATQGRPESDSPLLVLNPAKIHAAMEVYTMHQAATAAPLTFKRRLRGWFAAAKQTILKRVRPQVTHADLTNSVTAPVNATYRHIAVHGTTPPTVSGGHVILNPTTVSLAHDIYAANHASFVRPMEPQLGAVQQLLQRVKSLTARSTAPVVAAAAVPEPFLVHRPPVQMMAGEFQSGQSGQPPQMQ
jgi:hypothetical protein